MSNETLTQKKKNGYRLNGFSHSEIGDDHLYTGIKTPMKPDAFLLTDEEKKERIADLFWRDHGCNGFRPYRRFLEGNSR